MQTINHQHSSVNNLTNEELVDSALKNTSARMNGNEGLFVLINVEVNSISGKYTLKNTMVTDSKTGTELSSQEAVKNPQAQLIPSSELNFTGQARDNVYKLFRAEGFNLGKHMFLVKADKVLMIYKELLSIQAKLTADTQQFYDDYPRIIEEQKMLNHLLRDIIDQYVPKREKLKQQIRMKIGAPQAVGVHSGAMSEVQSMLESTGNLDTSQSSSLCEQIVIGFCKDVTHFWNYNLRQIKDAIAEPKKKKLFLDPKRSKSGVAGVAIEILQNLRKKVDDLTLLEPSFEGVGNMLDTAVSLLPEGYKTRATSIKDFDAMKLCLQVMTSLKSEDFVKEVLANYGQDSQLVDKLEAELYDSETVTSQVENQNSEDSSEVETSMQELFSQDLFQVNGEAINIESNSQDILGQLLSGNNEEVIPEEIVSSAKQVDFDEFAEVFAEEFNKQPVKADASNTNDEPLAIDAHTSISSYAREAEIIEQKHEVAADSHELEDKHEEPETIAAFGKNQIEIADLFNGLL